MASKQKGDAMTGGRVSSSDSGVRVGTKAPVPLVGGPVECIDSIAGTLTLQ
jgi:hypothetical protein